MDRMAGFESRLQAGQLLTAISNRIVAMVHEYCGYGPTETNTFLRDDMVFVVRRGSGLTPLEKKTIIESGRPQLVQEMRRDFEEMMSERFTDAVEELTGRKVLAFLPQVSVEPDLAVEIFLLDRPIDAVVRIDRPAPTHGAYQRRHSWSPSPD